MKHELQNIISGKSQVEFGANIQAIASYLRDSKRTGTLAEKGIHCKRQEEKFIKQFCDLVKDWFFTYCNFTSLFGYNSKEVLITDFLIETIKYNQENASILESGKKNSEKMDRVFKEILDY
jgi:hypothetical protein